MKIPERDTEELARFVLTDKLPPSIRKTILSLLTVNDHYNAMQPKQKATSK